MWSPAAPRSALALHQVPARPNQSLLLNAFKYGSIESCPNYTADDFENVGNLVKSLTSPFPSKLFTPSDSHFKIKLMTTRRISILLVFCLAILNLNPSAHSAAKTYNLSITIVGPYNWRSLAGTEAEARNPRECYAGQYAVISSGATVRIKNSSNKT